MFIYSKKKADFLSAEKYRDRYTELYTKFDQLSLKETTEIASSQRKFKLPKIEFKTFNGNSKEYLTFRSQFRKIDEDSSMPPEDKFQYLLQAIVPKSKIARVFESFPVTADNYSKAIDQLKDRFGREDLLVQIYVRDLLSMVMKNGISGRATPDLPTLYDELKSKIRAFESLGRTQEKYADFLSPLVESCLSEEILIARERHRNFNEASDGIRSLEQLLNFLNKEVRGEQLIELARSGFASGSQRKLDTCPKSVQDYGTASMLVNTFDKSAPGPNLIEQIPDIIDRFRSYPIGISADIEMAFLQLGIAPEHRDFLRFFYPKEDEEIIYRHCRVVFWERRKIRLCNLNLSEKEIPWYARKFSKFYSIIRLVAWVLRFINNAKNSYEKRNLDKNLSLNEIKKAEIRLIQSIQNLNIPDLKSISNLCVLKDEEGIIRVKTRITERIDTPNFLSPILLPGDCIFTKRFIEHFHSENYHARTQLLLCLVREEYWILGGRRTVEKDLTPITPAMFLCDNPTSETRDLDVLDCNHLRKRLRFRAKMIQVLRERFRKEYLGQLVQRHRQHPQSSNIQIGDIVLIGDDVKKRLQWLLARVIELIPGKEGHVETVRVKTQHSILVRPIQRIFPLEVSGSNFQKQLGPSANSSMKTFVNDVNLPEVSRFGREIKRPNRLNFSDS
ncbi:hypothetical protein HNY73_011259 [Argiope bruennichi]|uniref:DUF5641 domain-containing protein n=1 Tax=Argiope bruennichi TaxID=94029 RepID=A0A8T0F9U7_ARGBR|nr:hypothetical protein HNY73_011259 [Argiope bruennichi]